MKIRICIVGYGFVGSALASSFKKDVALLKIDPKLKTSTDDIKEFLPDITFICVPTPMKKDGDQDVSILNSVLMKLNDLKIKSSIVIKSTVLPKNLKLIQEKYSKIVYNPEFLREKHAEFDFKNAKFHIFGGDNSECKKVSNFYDKNTLAKGEHIFMDILSASFMKYTINSFLSLKVIFFNELYDLYIKTKCDYSWDDFIDVLKKDKRLGDSHMDVPGHDERRGYGGACFPKDSNAFYDFSVKENSELSLLKKSININNKYRSRYNTASDREIEQNISFNNIEERN